MSFLVLRQPILKYIFKVGGGGRIAQLIERERQTLGLVLREKIFESQDLEKIIKLEIERTQADSTKLIFEAALDHVLEVREDCYNIAKKLGVK